MRPSPTHRRVLALGAAIALLMAPPAAKGQEREQGSRQLWDEDFVRSRPEPAKSPARPLPRRSPNTRRERVAGPSFVGVTLWRLKPAEEGSRGLAVSGEGRRWLPERAEVDATLPEGQPVRLTIEVSRSGYLYVIDRERYADGSLGEPVLVFPTLRIRGGDNAVAPGRVIEIPDLGDDPPYLTLKRSRPDHVDEQLLLLVTPEKLAEVRVGQEAQALTRGQVAEWERRWGGTHAKLEMAGGAGRGYTEAEREAATGSSRLLTRGEPLPQTLYRVEGSPAEPTLVTVTLRIAGGR